MLNLTAVSTCLPYRNPSETPREQETARQLNTDNQITWGPLNPLQYIQQYCCMLFLSLLLFSMLQKTSPELADKIGPYYSGIGAYVGATLGMIVGSLLKPQSAIPIERNSP